jgi:hypothetical protein
MGIESGLIAAGVSSGTAATVSAVATGVLTAAAGAVVTSALAPKQPKAEPQIPAISQADKPPQAARAPDLSAIAKKNALTASAAGALSGNNSTLLTGSQGISPSSLNLGRSTLLGQ